MQTETKDITQHRLRTILFECIDEVRAGTMDVARAKMVNEMARTINTQANLQMQAANTFHRTNAGQLFQTPETTQP